MIRDFFMMLVNFLVVEPAQAEFASRLARLGAPATVTQEVSSCVAAARPVLADRYSDDPLLGVTTAFRLWTGMRSYETVLVAEVPSCATAFQAARPYLSSRTI